MNVLARLQERNTPDSSTSPAPVSFRGRRWVFPKIDRQVFDALVQARYSRAMAGVLAARGFDFRTAPHFIHAEIETALPPAGYILDLDVAVDRIAQAAAFGEKVAIWGDYDVDGATSSAIMARLLRAAGVTPTIKIPDRMKEGYGPNTPGLLSLREEGHSLVIIVDSGVTAFEQLKAAKQAGLDCIVIDHHAAEPVLPEAVAIVNPNRLDQGPGFGQMCAAGVAWLVARGVAEQMGLGVELVDNWLDIVALGTVCDVVALKGINRAIVRRGLELMDDTSNPGIIALKSYARVDGKMTPYHLGFQLGPRINAGGRIGESWMGAVLLSSDDMNECMSIAERLTELNSERQRIEKEYLLDAEAKATTQLDRQAIVVLGDDYHEGVIGIVAGRLKEAFDKPVIVFTKVHNEDATAPAMAKGSGRSMPGFDMGAAVIAARQAGILAKGGGHAMAAGATIEIDKIGEFTAMLEEAIRASKFSETGATTKIDVAIDPSDANVPFVTSLSDLEPFGQGNPQPRFLLRGVAVTDVDSNMRSKGHFKGTIRRNGTRLTALMFKAVGTPLGDALFQHEGQLLDLVVTLDINEWQDRRIAQAKIEDAMLSRATHPNDNGAR